MRALAFPSLHLKPSPTLLLRVGFVMLTFLPLYFLSSLCLALMAGALATQLNNLVKITVGKLRVRKADLDLAQRVR